MVILLKDYLFFKHASEIVVCNFSTVFGQAIKWQDARLRRYHIFEKEITIAAIGLVTLIIKSHSLDLPVVLPASLYLSGWWQSRHDANKGAMITTIGPLSCWMYSRLHYNMVLFIMISQNWEGESCCNFSFREQWPPYIVHAIPWMQITWRARPSATMALTDYFHMNNRGFRNETLKALSIPFDVIKTIKLVGIILSITYHFYYKDDETFIVSTWPPE